MSNTHIAELMWDAYATQAGGKTFDGKPLPTWDELGDERQSCWAAAASVISGHIEKLEAGEIEFDRIIGDYASENERFRDRIQMMEMALREIAFARPECCAISDAMQYIARKALEGEDD